ncbi:cupin domain-containing protein [Litoreibacter arenae]|uniref:Cupin type-2 domain-containing protein n=1 Tax=Litoreibacter arenae DSM 19593 TaxID=1123360 RepID=S9QKR6_9RHOB|nr:cupin domain-containing protein [Litoreibacter arenae]EPX80173.1 hypothetical protein thalar_01512 [Litoreibacter arenae DSM 19593]
MRPQKPAQHVKHVDWKSDKDNWKGVIGGSLIDSDVTVLFYATDEVGIGPKWHVHPYDEIFVLRKGRARFTIGDEVIEASEGDVLMGPAAVPHKYENLGPGRLESIDIHLSRDWIQTDLVDPDAT